MSYYGPSQQAKDQIKNGKTSTVTVNGRLPQYDYNCRYRNYNSLSRSEIFNRRNKRLRKKVRSVPWRDEWELQAVGTALLSVLHECEKNRSQNLKESNQEPSTSALTFSPQEAFATISVWKSRLIAMEGLPHAIESTGALAQIYWRDSLRRKQRTMWGVSVMELRLAYATAIVRCINGFADSLQQQRAIAASVANLCGQLGISAWLVDTRHDSSHNTLPSIAALRLASSTLLEFMKSEFWIPRCNNWNNQITEYAPPSEKLVENKTVNDGDDNNNSESNYKQNVEQRNLNKDINQTPIGLLLDYKACAFTWATTRSTNAYEKETEESKGPTSSLSQKKGKKAKSSTIQKTTILPYDPLFGEVGSISSSGNDNDDDNGIDADNEGSNLNNPMVGSIWGPSIGTNANRFALLEPPKRNKICKRKGNKDKHKNIQNTPKKRKGEKSPNDCAKLFVQSISSPQEGYAIVTQYLIWGGVGEAPIGRGVLIPGSENAFPATPKGISECWQLYTPLIHVVCRTWPGFTAYMVINLVDCVLSIENNVIYQSDHIDTGSSRKLYFLSAWIRLFLSQRFVAALDRTFSINSSNRYSYGQKKGNTNPLELPLAQLNHLESLGYPLHSLLDRCLQHKCDYNGNIGNDNMISSSISVSGPTKTSGNILQNLQKILGAKKTDKFGYSYGSNGINKVAFHQNQLVGKTNNTSVKTGHSISLDEMEAMLSDSHCEVLDIVSNNDVHEGIKKETVEIGKTETLSRPNRPAWIRCENWDPCSIGTLPGYR